MQYMEHRGFFGGPISHSRWNPYAILRRWTEHDFASQTPPLTNDHLWWDMRSAYYAMCRVRNARNILQEAFDKRRIKAKISQSTLNQLRVSEVNLVQDAPCLYEVPMQSCLLQSLGGL